MLAAVTVAVDRGGRMYIEINLNTAITLTERLSATHREIKYIRRIDGMNILMRLFRFIGQEHQMNMSAGTISPFSVCCAHDINGIYYGTYICATKKNI